MPGRRNTGELLVLGIAFTICLFVLLVTAAVIIIEIMDPDRDTSGAARAIADVISTLVALLAGYLSGRTDNRAGR